MRHLDSTNYSRWMAVGIGILCVVPLASGCRAKTETTQQPLAPAADQQPTNPQSVAPPSSPATASHSGSDVPPLAPGGADAESNSTPAQAESADSAPEEVEPEPVERPRSFFRSIGRALRKGAADAAGLTSDESDTGSAPPATSQPADPN